MKRFLRFLPKGKRTEETIPIAEIVCLSKDKRGDTVIHLANKDEILTRDSIKTLTARLYFGKA